MKRCIKSKLEKTRRRRISGNLKNIARRWSSTQTTGGAFHWRTVPGKPRRMRTAGAGPLAGSSLTMTLARRTIGLWAVRYALAVAPWARIASSRFHCWASSACPRAPMPIKIWSWLSGGAPARSKPLQWKEWRSTTPSWGASSRICIVCICGLGGFVNLYLKRKTNSKWNMFRTNGKIENIVKERQNQQRILVFFTVYF